MTVELVFMLLELRRQNLMHLAIIGYFFLLLVDHQFLLRPEQQLFQMVAHYLSLTVRKMLPPWKTLL
jgi:hypothetical protein